MPYGLILPLSLKSQGFFIFGMRYRIHLILLFSSFICSAYSQPVIKFDKTIQRLGFVHQGDTLKFEYTFTNTGNQPLVVSETKVTCGCTIAEKPTHPVNPGQEGVIKVRFNTTPAIDRQDRTVIIISNASNSPSVVRFKCVVLKAKKEKK